MKLHYRELLPIVLLALTNPAFACKSDSTMHNDILECQLEEYQPLDNELNRLYQQKMANLSAKNKLLLRQSQRNWVKKQEMTCVVDEKNYGRESHFDALQCQINMTKERINFLKTTNIRVKN